MHLAALRPVAEQLFADIRDLSHDGVGVTRDSYGHGESATAAHLCAFARRHGLVAEADRAANVVFRLPQAPAGGPAIWAGSHIDSVPQGGNYDGLAGVVAGLLCLLARREAAPGGGPAFEVLGLRGEESAWFGKAYMGSGALLGRLQAADLELRHRDTGARLADCMQGAGADLAAIAAGQPLFDRRRVRAYLELHIEQGPVMVQRQLPVAVVSGIRGNVRHGTIVCEGDAQHSGAVPRELRHDAMFAVADLIMRLDAQWRALLAEGADLVVTTGVVSTDAAEHSVSRIPGHVRFSFEARSQCSQTLEAFYALMRAQCQAVETERGVRFVFDARQTSAPATLDAGLSRLLARSCEALSMPPVLLPSGAGHDAAQFANAGIPAAMLFVRNQHGSHNPHEAMDLDDFMLGTQALDHAVAQLQMQ
ncbi:MAG: hydantoinase/carbamoylase family amidase [Burkholderiaceae bacterium]|jgi:N-carbamoyl-L-amino-acid hydrolase|nr:hydantoinase/carbamoylase family amidase [Burkholderiaceae bacterium]